jgi:integrase
MVNIEILELQRDLLLEQLMELEEKLNDNGIKKDKQGFTLFLRNGVFYVKYTDLETGKQIPTNRSLETADRNEAETLARKYRASILKTYYDKKNKIRDLPKFFSEYYQSNSAYLQEQLKRYERKINERTIRQYERFINNYFLDFLKAKKIKRINEITLKRLKDFQAFLVEKGLKPKTINDRINGAIKPIFTSLLLKDAIKETPFPKGQDFRFNLPESETRSRPHILPIYESLMALSDNELWKLYKSTADIKTNKIANEKHYKKYRLICLLMATCGLRNAEIFMLRKENIIKIRRTWFIDVINSHIENKGLKTKSSKRKVPIPSITLESLNDYIAENNISDYLFYSGGKTINYNMFWFAKNQFGIHCGYTENELKEMNIEFYSFRHLYKSMLQRSDMKIDIIEYFMGHSVNFSKMNENYNHLAEIGDNIFENIGIQAIEYIDSQCRKAIEKYNLFPIDPQKKKVSLTDNKGNIKEYYAYVLEKIDYELETYLFIKDLQEKYILPDTENKQELIKGLNKLLETQRINESRYNECIDYVENM